MSCGVCKWPELSHPKTRRIGTLCPLPASSHLQWCRVHIWQKQFYYNETYLQRIWELNWKSLCFLDTNDRSNLNLKGDNVIIIICNNLYCRLPEYIEKYTKDPILKYIVCTIYRWRKTGKKDYKCDWYTKGMDSIQLLKKHTRYKIIWYHMRPMKYV